MKHTFEDGSYGIGHIMSEQCPCKPTASKKTVQNNTGRYGKHQGYRTEVVLHHHELPKEGESND